MQTRGSTLQDSPPHPTPHHTMLIPNRPHLQLPQYRTNTALPQKIYSLQVPKYPRERTKKSGKHKHTHPGFQAFFLSFFLSTMLCLDNHYDYYYYYFDSSNNRDKYYVLFPECLPTTTATTENKIPETTNAKGKNNESSHSGTPSQSLSLSLCEIPGGYHIGTL